MLTGACLYSSIPLRKISSHLLYLSHDHATHGSLERNAIGNQGAEAVAKALKHTRTLTKLRCANEMRIWMKTRMSYVDGKLLLRGY